MTRLHFLILLTVVLISTALGQSTKPAATAEIPAIKEAARQFAEAIAKDDLVPLKKDFAGTAEDFKLVEAMHEMVMASKRLQQAGKDRWPDAFADNNGGEGFFNPSAMLANLEKELLPVAGEMAAFRGGFVLKKIDGKWKVIDIMGIRENKPFLAKMLPLLTTATLDTAVEINKGTYPTFTAATVALGNKINKGLAAEGGPATKPAR